MIPGAILTVIFLALALLHVYWIVVGSDDFSKVVPEIEGKPAFEPGPVSTAIVASLLLVAAWLAAAQAELMGLERSSWTRVGVWGLLVAFLLRSIGDFRLVGFFKRVRGSRFARLDSWLYSPFCLTIAALCLALLRVSGE